MPSPRSRAKTFLFVGALATLGSVGLLLSAEIVVRIKFALQHKDAGYLVIGLLKDRRRIKAQPTLVAVPKNPTGTYARPGTPARLTLSLRVRS